MLRIRVKRDLRQIVPPGRQWALRTPSHMPTYNDLGHGDPPGGTVLAPVPAEQRVQVVHGGYMQSIDIPARDFGTRMQAIRTTGPRAGVAGVGSYLPSRVVLNAEVEQRLASARGDGRPTLRARTIERRSGVRQRHYIDPSDDASDLAVRAARVALDDAGLGPEDIDLLIFASASQDLIEPATAHIVNAKLGGRATVFDVKNACNSFLNGMQIADALTQTGQHRRVLVCTGEAPSMGVRWAMGDGHMMKESFVGYTLGDAGAAVVLDARTDRTGITSVEFRAASEHWELCTLQGGGTRHLRDLDQLYFRGHGTALRNAFIQWGAGELKEMVAATGTDYGDYDAILVHQVTGPLFETFLDVTGIDPEKTVRVIETLGNVASASLPIQLGYSRRTGKVGDGARVLMIGLGAGVSIGLLGLQL